jgi:hypothetical protein
MRTTVLAALTALTLMTAACSDNAAGADPVTTAVLEAEPEADRSDIAVDIEIIKDQEPDATDEQIAGWIIEVIQWNNCLEQHPMGTGCIDTSPDNPLNW